MLSIRKWLLAKMLPQVPADLEAPASTSRANVFAADAGLSSGQRVAAGQQRRSLHHPRRQPVSSMSEPRAGGSECGTSWTGPFDVSTSSLLKFYYADDQLNMITAELDSFDGRKDPMRCTNLVNQLR